MKIEFPLWVVMDPKPGDELVDIRWEAVNFAGLECTLGGAFYAKRPYWERNVALYTTEAEATADAQARLNARDGRGEWLRLDDLRHGAIFETKDGTRAVKSEYCYDNYSACECTLLTSGCRAHFAQGDYADERARAQAHNATLVREIKL